MKTLESVLTLDRDRVAEIAEKIADLAVNSSFHIENARKIVELAETKEEAYAAGVIAALIATHMEILENPVEAIAKALLTAKTLEIRMAVRANSN